MRQFSSSGSGFRLWNLSLEAKIIYSFFCLTSLLALGSSVLLYEDLVGPSLRAGRLTRVQRYYGGGPADAVPAGAPDGDKKGAGPDIALPEEVQAPALVVAVPYRKLLEVTHFHLFTVPVFLLIICHLFMLTGASPASKVGWILGGWLSSLLHLAAPWVIRYAGPHLAVLYPLSGAGLFLCSAVLTGYPAVVMWRGQRRGPPRREAHPEIEPGE